MPRDEQRLPAPRQLEVDLGDVVLGDAPGVVEMARVLDVQAQHLDGPLEGTDLLASRQDLVEGAHRRELGDVGGARGGEPCHLGARTLGVPTKEEVGNVQQRLRGTHHLEADLVGGDTQRPEIGVDGELAIAPPPGADDVDLRQEHVPARRADPRVRRVDARRRRQDALGAGARERDHVVDPQHARRRRGRGGHGCRRGVARLRRRGGEYGSMDDGTNEQRRRRQMRRDEEPAQRYRGLHGFWTEGRSVPGRAETDRADSQKQDAYRHRCAMPL